MRPDAYVLTVRISFGFGVAARAANRLGWTYSRIEMFTLDQVAPGPLSAVRQTPTIPMANDLVA